MNDTLNIPLSMSRAIYLYLKDFYCENSDENEREVKICFNDSDTIDIYKTIKDNYSNNHIKISQYFNYLPIFCQRNFFIKSGIYTEKHLVIISAVKIAVVLYLFYYFYLYHFYYRNLYYIHFY